MNHNDYIDAGFRIFGLYGADGSGNCACGNPKCKAAYKHPRTSNWQFTPNWAEDQLEIMEEMGQFDTGFGVLCNGYLIIDIDPRNGGKLDDWKEYYDQSGFVVATGGGGWHIYFSLPECAALVSHLHQYKGVDFKSSGFVVGAGSIHGSGAQYEADKGHPCEITEAPEKLLKLLEKKATHRAMVDGSALDVTDKELVEILSHVDPDIDYDTWVRCGMAIHHTTHGAGFSIWDEWSSKGSKYSPDEMDKKWHSFGKSTNPVTLGTLLHHAKDGGYQEPVTFEADFEFEEAADTDINDVSHIDLLRPPGFVGELCEWINSQSIRPRENLAVATALSSISALGGARVKDEEYGVSPNLFMFCVADASTGKNAIQQAQMKIMRAADMSRCVYGAIKSEQEIIRNLLEHQIALYNIDEVAGIMGKIDNAKSKGGTPYLESVYDTLMDAYTKTDGILGISGDLKREVFKKIKNEAAALQKVIDNNEDESGIAEKKLNSLLNNMISLEDGITNPFLSLIGFTVPNKFNYMVNYESVTSGFFARALVVQEKEEAPKKKSRKYVKDPLSDRMKMAISQLAWGGSTPTERGLRIEFDRTSTVNTTPEAVERMNQIDDYFEDLMVSMKTTGMHSLAARGFELVIKLSLVLAMPSGLRTVEHCDWAFAFVKRDLENKANLASANIADEENRHDEALMRKIIGLLDADVAHTQGVIFNRMRKYKKEDIEKALNILESNGKIKKKAVKKRGPSTVSWYLA